MAIESLSDIVKSGQSAFSTGGGGGDPVEVPVVIDSVQPSGTKYLWIQTGLPNNGFSLWFNDGL